MSKDKIRQDKMDQRTPRKPHARSGTDATYDPADQPLLHRAGGQPVVDLDNYFPAYLAWTANKWARSASQLYLKRFGIGIEAWRLLVLLAVEGRITANRICQVIGMDKASVSRNFKQMHESGLIELSDDPTDKRKRFAELTQAGFALHDRMLPVVMRREQRLLSCLSKEERATLQSYLRRVHANLPALDHPSDYDDDV